MHVHPLALRAALCGAALAGCAHTLRGANPDVGVKLPEDHGAHDDAQTEWWHVHGHLVDDAGRGYDFFLGFVKQHTDLDHVWFWPVRWFVDPMQVAYFTVTDRARGRFHVREKHAYPDVWAASAARERLDVHHDSWFARMDADGALGMRAHTRTTLLTLRLVAQKPAALLGHDGYLDVPPASSHYYYSVPRMSAQGALVVEGQTRAVRGTAWLKHEWGFMYTEKVKGWVWFGVQLSSGQELEIALIFDHAWDLMKGSFAVIEERDGTVTPIELSELQVKELGNIWRSPRTNTVYPINWMLEIPGRGSLVLEATVPGQEMVVFPANLWAGSLTVEGVFDDQDVRGDCFAEIAGLDEPFGRSGFGSGRPAKWEKVAPRKPRPSSAPTPPAGSP